MKLFTQSRSFKAIMRLKWISCFFFWRGDREIRLYYQKVREVYTSPYGREEAVNFMKVGDVQSEVADLITRADVEGCGARQTQTAVSSRQTRCMQCIAVTAR